MVVNLTCLSHISVSLHLSGIDALDEDGHLTPLGKEVGGRLCSFLVIVDVCSIFKKKNKNKKFPITTDVEIPSRSETVQSSHFVSLIPLQRRDYQVCLILFILFYFVLFCFLFVCLFVCFSFTSSHIIIYPFLLLFTQTFILFDPPKTLQYCSAAFCRKCVLFTDKHAWESRRGKAQVPCSRRRSRHAAQRFSHLPS